jgi:hypothetical protein
MANRIQLRRGGSQEWRNANPVLAQGEVGIDLDSGRIKIGDGSTAWNSLAYERPVESVANTANSLVQRDSDGNFSAGTITATVIGNASTASRLANVRQVQITQDIVASGTFDGSTNLNLAAELQTITSLPHYDGTQTSSGQYTRVVVDAKGRITNASNPTTIQDYGLDTSIEGSGAQPYDNDLNAVAGLTSTGIGIRIGDGNWTTRSILSTAGQIVVTNGSGTAGNPQIDLATTTVVDGDYNTESLTSVSANGPAGEPFGTETVNAVKFTVDDRGRLQSATNVPIATAREGSKYATYNAGTSYSRYDIIEEGGNVYQAIQDILAGAGAPAHTDSSDTGGWRFLAAAATEQKGLASFAQEDFDVDGNGHVTIAALGVDNTQLQNNRISFADGNTKEDFELDQELTATTGYRGFNYLNYVTVNDTSGSLLFTANNTGNSGAGDVDINVDTHISGANIYLDRPGTTPLQTIERTAGSLKLFHNVNSATNRVFDIVSTNAGAGSATINITADNDVVLSSTNASNYVKAEDIWFRANAITSDNSTIIIDPATEGDDTGLVQIKGNLQVDGTTTTVNSTTMTVDDVVITLGGDTAPTAPDTLDRGIEIRYYDSQARLGFFGWDANYGTLAGTTGGYRFLYDATNTAEVFSGTDAGVVAGNLALTSNVGSTSATTGTLVVTGGVGISENVHIGGTVDISNDFDINSVFTVASATGDTVIARDLNVQRNTDIDGTLNVDGDATFQTNVTINGDNSLFDIQTNAGVSKFTVDTDNGNTQIEGTLTVTDAVDLNNTLNVLEFVRLEKTAEPQIALNGSTGLYDIQNSDYGSFKFDGGGYVEGDTLYNSDIYVNGQIIQKEDTTANYNRQNYLEVRYKLRTGTRAIYTPSYATHDTSNLRVYGGAGIATDLHIGEDLFIGKKNNGDTIDFQVIGASGNTTIGRSGAGTASVGTLTVYGDTLLDRDLTVNGSQITLGNANTDILTVNSDATFTDNVTVNQAVDFDSTLNVDGAVDFNSTLVVDGQTTIFDSVIINAANEEFAIQNGSGVDKFTVDTDNGNTDIQGTVTIQGQTVINDTLIINEAGREFAVQNGSAVDRFTVASDSGNTNIVGTLTVGNATQLNNTLGVTGVSSFTNAADQTLTGLYAADGAVRITGGAGVAKNLSVGGNMRVYGDFEISGSTTQSGNTGFSGRVSISNTSDITSYTDNTVSLSTEGGFRAEKNAYIGGDFYIWDAANSRAAFSVDNSTGNGEFHNNLIVGGDLVVNGSTTTVNSTTVTIDDPIFTLGGDSAPTSDDNKDRGIEFRYYSGSARLGFFGYDDSANEFVFLTSATNSSEVFSGTDGNLRANQLRLTGTGTILDVDADAIVNGDLTVDGQIISTVTGQPPLVVASNTKVNNLNADLLDGLTTSSTDTSGNSVVSRTNGNFSANQITVNNGIGANAGIQGNATTADELRTARTFTIDGVVNATVSFDGSQNVTLTTTFDDADMDGLAAMSGTGFVSRTAANTYAQRTLVTSPASGSGITVTQGDGVAGNPTINILSATTNAANNLVLRDGSGGFAAGAVNVVTLAASSNATVGGTLGVTGVTTLTGLLNANGGIAVDTNNFTVDGTTGAVDTASTLNADGAVTFGSTLGVTGATTLSSTLGVTGATTLSDTLGVTGAATLSSTLGVTGATTLSSTLAVTGTSTFTGTITANGGVIGDVTGEVSSIANHSTTDLTEGTNLYYTNERVDDRVAALISGGTGITATYNDAGNLLTLSAEFSEFDTDDVVEGTTNLFTTAARTRTHFTYGTGIELNAGELSVTQADIDTDNVTEGVTNLFTTAARTRTHFTYGTGIELSVGGELSVTQADIDTDNVTEGVTNIFYTEGRFDTSLAGKTTDDLTEGTNLYYTTARWDTQLATKTTDDITEGVTNVFYTETRFDTSLATKTTDDVAEGSTNLYYTDARADARIAAATTDDLSEGSTNLYYTDARAEASFDTKIAAATTDDLSEGSTNLYYTDARADVRVAAATGANLDLSQKTTSDLSEGTNLYYTEARVQDKLDNAFAQLQAMLNNLATTTTLTLNLSGDPTPGAVVTAGAISNDGIGGFSDATAVATTSDGVGTGLTVDITTTAGAVTAIVVNAGGTDYEIADTITIANPNAGGVATFNFGTLSGGSNYVTATGLTTTTTGSGTGLTVDITASAGVITGVTVATAGTGYEIGDTITIVQAAVGADADPGAGGTIDTATIFTDATFALADITTMEVGATVTGATSGTTGVITALGASAITIDTVDGFFKVGEVVSANDVTTLTVQSFG